LRAAAIIGAGVDDGGCSARLQAPFSAASIQTLRMARPPLLFSFEEIGCPDNARRVQ
jgi:hypothetical protein